MGTNPPSCPFQMINVPAEWSFQGYVIPLDVLVLGLGAHVASALVHLIERFFWFWSYFEFLLLCHVVLFVFFSANECLVLSPHGKKVQSLTAGLTKGFSIGSCLWFCLNESKLEAFSKIKLHFSKSAFSILGDLQKNIPDHCGFPH